MKQTIKASIMDLGKASQLTLGHTGRFVENMRYRAWGDPIELGQASGLTLGSGQRGSEESGKPMRNM